MSRFRLSNQSLLESEWYARQADLGADPFAEKFLAWVQRGSRNLVVGTDWSCTDANDRLDKLDNGSECFAEVKALLVRDSRNHETGRFLYRRDTQ